MKETVRWFLRISTVLGAAQLGLLLFLLLVGVSQRFAPPRGGFPKTRRFH